VTRLRVGLKLPNGIDGEKLRSLAIAAESIGVDSLWLDAHVAVPAQIESAFALNASGKPPFSYRDPFSDPFATLAFAAAVTSRIRLGTAIVPYLSSHVLLLAKQAATVDLLSNGRFELGIGAGWLSEEGRALGHPVDHPTARMAEAIDLMRAAWRDGQVAAHGRFHEFETMGVEPQPPQRDGLPVWIGGVGPAALRTAVAKNAGILLSNPTNEAVRHAAAALSAVACPRVGALLALPKMNTLGQLEKCGLNLAIVTGIRDAAQLESLAEVLAQHCTRAN
jgi:probable F420-dependent oxidoreductase